MLSSLNLLRAEMGGQFLITTRSFILIAVPTRQSLCVCLEYQNGHVQSLSSCVRYFLLRSIRYQGYKPKAWGNLVAGSTFPVALCVTHLETVTVAVFLMTPTLVTTPVKAIGGIVAGAGGAIGKYEPEAKRDDSHATTGYKSLRSKICSPRFFHDQKRQ